MIGLMSAQKKRLWLFVSGTALVVLAISCVQAVPLMRPAVPAPAVQLAVGDSRYDADPLATSVAQIGLLPTPTAGPGASPDGDAQSTPAAQSRGRQSASATATPAARGIENRKSVTLRRGPIVDVTQLSGRIASTQEASLSFPISGTVDSVLVRSGEAVQAGQVIATIDARDAARALRDAEAEAAITRLRLQQSHAKQSAQVQARQQQAAEADRTRRINDEKNTEAVTQLQEQLRQAQANLDRVKAGASTIQRLQAQGAAAAAQAAYDKAQADLARLQAGPRRSDVFVLEADVNSASAALRKAEADREKLTAPADPVAVANARRAVADAQAEAERIRNLTPAPGQKLNASEQQRRLESAQYTITAAKEQLDALLRGPDKSAVDLADFSVAGAKDQLAAAQARLELAKSGATSDLLDAAIGAVEVDRLALQSAQTNLAEVTGHPTPEELADALSKVDQAQAALDRRQQSDLHNAPNDGATISLTAAQDADAAAVEQLQLEHTLQQQQSQLEALRQQLDASQLRAPFSGTVETVLVRSGDKVEAGQASGVLGGAGVPVVSVDLTDGSTGQLAIGTPAKIQMDGAELGGSLVSMGDSNAGSGRSGIIQVTWPNNPPALGLSVQVRLNVQRKDSALLVPRRALHSVGGRKYLEVVDGGQSKNVDVTVGMSVGEEIEVVAGVDEGQTVLLPD